MEKIMLEFLEINIRKIFWGVCLMVTMGIMWWVFEMNEQVKNLAYLLAGFMFAQLKSTPVEMKPPEPTIEKE